MTLRHAAAALCAVLAFLGGTAHAHEFWMLPDRFQVRTGEPLNLSMHVGEYFEGERVGLSRPFITRLWRLSGDATMDLGAQLSTAPAGSVRVNAAARGTLVFAADTATRYVELPAGQFHAYLREEGLDFIIAARQKAGLSDLPGRERFRRHVKTLVRGAGPADAGALKTTGQRLEILPTTDPFAAAAGARLGFQILWEGKPLADALVKFWQRRDSQLLIVRARANEQGRVTLTPPWAGVWMASVVHMVTATDTPEVDWDSHWANLSFELPAR